MERISIQELAAVLTTKSGLKKKEAERFTAMIFDVVKEGLMSDRLVKIKGLGTFKVIDIESRESINVNTGERVLIEGHGKITFTPDSTMKELVNRPFSQFETVVLNDGVDFDDFNDPADQTEVADTDEESTDVEELPVTVEEKAVEDEVDVKEAEEPVPTVETIETEEKVPVEEMPEETPEEAPEEFSDQEIIEFFSNETSDQEESPVAIESMEPDDQEDTLSPASTQDSEQEPENDEEQAYEEDDDYESESHKRKLLSWILVLAACLVCFVLGYLLGRYHSKLLTKPVVIETVNPDTLKAKKEIAPVVKDTTAVVKKDTVIAEKVDTPQAVAPQTAQPEVKEIVKPKTPEQILEIPTGETVKPVVVADDLSKYEKMDVRVRTGAYRIIGTLLEVKVKAGETLKRISNRYLGPDMECYVEVYNGLNASSMLKEGQVIKIPKLQLKKHKGKK